MAAEERPDRGARGYREFEFDLPAALEDQLVKAFEEMEFAPLNVGNVSGVAEVQGVYQLFLDGALVYIGKTDSDAGLQQRLHRHSEKIQHRRNLDPSRVAFKAIRVFVFTAMDLEAQLIRRYRGDKGTAWNNSGFGSNDPGRNRDSSQPGRFDLEFPIDIDRELEGDYSGTHSVAQIAIRLKSELPYTFRFASDNGTRKPHRDLESSRVTIPERTMTARKLIVEITRALPPGWQATALSAVLILYKETNNKYPNAKILARS